MGCYANITATKFPAQGDQLHRRVQVCFLYNTREIVEGTIVRADTEEPFRVIIKLDDGRVVLASECQYSPLCNERMLSA